MVRRVADRFRPERIVLFGSHADGTAGPDSDADLLVVMRVTGSRRKIACAIDASLTGIPLAADIIVATPEEAERSRDRVGSIIGGALRDGTVVYERHA